MKEHCVHQFILLAALGWLVSGPASTHAQGLYKWVDSRGVVHYTNTPTNATAKTVDDALPPASNFQRPAPLPEPVQEAAKPNTADSSTPVKAPSEPSPEQAAGDSTPTTDPVVTENQEPSPAATHAPE